MSKNPTNFSRDFIKTAIEYKVADQEKLRDYDILVDRAKGMSLGQLATKYNRTRAGILYILNQY